MPSAKPPAFKHMLTDESFHFSAAFAGIVERCWQKAAPPPEWGLAAEEFRRLLERSVAHRFSGHATEAKLVEAYLETLHVADLALAGACSAGNAAAWDFFVAQFRPELYRAARAIAGEAQGREIADSLYADLYGLRETEGRRNSLFDYFHGRSKLSTWLRAVLAQRHVDEIRRTRKTEPLEDTETGQPVEVAPTTSPPVTNHPHDPNRLRLLAMLQATIAGVLGRLDASDRLRLAYYYVDELTLAQIGRLLDEHEATVSRKLERTRRGVRAAVDSELRAKKKLSEEQLRLCYEYAREEWPFDLARALSARD
jgi:RNA polymerase sigma factor (sigma-70 family)